MDHKMIFNECYFNYRISIKMNDLNNVTDIQDLLDIKIKELHNKCFESGYIKEDSIKIHKYSNGFLNPITFVPFIEYRLWCSANVFIPNKDDIYLSKIISINKIGIMCKIFYLSNNNKTYSPINIIIPKHTQKNDISQLKKEEHIYIKIIGYKFTKNSEYIQTIADYISLPELNEIRQLSKIFKKLVQIELNFEIDHTNIKQYLNIVKLILDKTKISSKELFIYNFILLKNIKYTTKKIVDLYNDYIFEYENKLNYNEDNIDSESIDVYDLETNDTELCEKSSNIDDCNSYESDDDSKLYSKLLDYTSDNDELLEINEEIKAEESGDDDDDDDDESIEESDDDDDDNNDNDKSNKIDKKN
tara:strand:+ start:2730 stop:3809 length:1080 start_codon:yes stop_codon:yes gene_type:complete